MSLSVSERGYAVIFKHQNFRGLDELPGSQYDAVQLKSTFEKFNIKVVIRDDFDLAEIKAEVQRLNDFNFTSYQFLVTVVLSYGKEGDFVYACNDKYNLEDTIINPIAKKNHTLTGKPKIFIVQACRREEAIQYDTQIFVPPRLTKYSSDIFLVFSCYEGNTTYSDPNNGGIFIQNLCKTIEEYGKTEFLTTIIEMVTNNLIKNNEDQLPQTMSTMSRPFIFGTSDFTKVKNGYAVIFNHLNYADNLDLERRTGTEFDVIALKKTFEKFKITPIVKDDLTLNQIKDEVSRLKDFDFKGFDCFIIVVLSLGRTKNTLLAFDREYNLNEVIVDPIINKNASLANKPKIFIIQASKGTPTSDIQSDTQTNNIYKKFSLPAITDLFFCFATFGDHLPHILNNGSLFIQKLCSILQDHGFEMSFNDIMENVGAELRVSDTYVQVPSVTKTTTKPIIFVQNKDPIRLKSVNSQILKNGYAIIFNQVTFDNTLEFSKRVGTSHDVTELKRTLKNFNISVNVHNDLTVAEIKEEVKKLKKFDFTSYDCLIVIVLSHGNEKNILMARDGSYEFYETIANPIVNKNKTLVEKPKIFLIQACKGTKLPICHSIQTDAPPIYKKVSMITNMFYIFSTYEGHVSHRSTREGTFFIQAFCQLLNQYKNTLSLNEIVENIVCKLNHKKRDHYQVPTITKTMVKAIFFVEKDSIDEASYVSEPSTSTREFETKKRAFDDFYQNILFNPSKTEDENLELKRAMLEPYWKSNKISQ